MANGIKQVIIIGAGVAGLAAASRLVERGFPRTNITVLEAQDRIGGRICTVPYGDAVIEIGAQWIHGEDGNAVFLAASQAKEVNEDIHTLESCGLDDNVVFAFEGNSKLSAAERQQFQDVYTNIEFQAEKDILQHPGSLGEYYTSKLEEHLNKGSLSLMTPKKAKAMLDWYHRFRNIVDGADNWHETSGAGHVCYVECPGDPLVTWKRGYSALFDILMKNIPKSKYGQELPLSDRIFLKKIVKQVHWDPKALENNDGKVRVACQDGSVYSGDCVLVTCSLGYLKENAKSMFFPPLPQRKMKAIQYLGYGTVDKLFLHFDKPWWSKNWGGVSFLRETTESKNWADEILGFYTLRNQPNLLIGWIHGSAARAAENCPESEVLRMCSERLKLYIGSDFPYTEPSKIIRNTWYTNPFFRGSYSFRSVDSQNHNVWASDLAESVKDTAGCPRIYFAGEATHDHYYSAVHGAVESGWREADRIAGSPFQMSKL